MNIILNRRRLLSGLAAASTAAAAPAAAMAASGSIAENPELLRLGDDLPALVTEYHEAKSARLAILAEWKPRWPRAPKALCVGLGDKDVERDLAGAAFSRLNENGERRYVHLETVESIENNIRWGEAALKYARTEQRRQRERERLAPYQELLPIAKRYEAKCERIRKASGYQAAVDRREAAREALASAIDAIMAEPARTMAGVIVQAQALEAWGGVEGLWRDILPGTNGWSTQLAASILEISKAYAVG
jgi:hypothetical protein